MIFGEGSSFIIEILIDAGIDGYFLEVAESAWFMRGGVMAMLQMFCEVVGLVFLGEIVGSVAEVGGFEGSFEDFRIHF